MAETFGVREHGHARFLLHAQHEGFAAARNDQVDQAGGAEHGGDEGAIGGWGVLYGGGRQAGGGQTLGDGFVDGGGGRKTFAAAAQDDGVAAFYADAGGVGADIGAGFVNHADDADRAWHAADAQAVGAGPFLVASGERIGQGGDVVEAGGHGLDAGRIQGEAVAERGGAFVGGQIAVVGLLDGGFAVAQGGCGLAQGGVARGGREARQGAGRGAGGVCGFVKRSFGRVEGGIHGRSL